MAVVFVYLLQGLKAADANGLSDPYVNVYLSDGSVSGQAPACRHAGAELSLCSPPTPSQATKQSTAVVERTLSPTFNQEFVYYGISESFVRRHDLM